MTKERPILFSGEMVRAILDGRKSQTRRVVKWPVLSRSDGGKRRIFTLSNIDEMNRLLSGPQSHPCCQFSPYGIAGRRLWVREKWRIGDWDENRPAFAIDYHADGFCRKEWLDVPDPMCDDGEFFNRLWQQSTDDAIKVFGDQDRYEWEPGESPCRWRPSIHMPRWASRILLEITDVRIERLQDICAHDCWKEGVLYSPDVAPHHEYQELWEKIHGADSWDKNPFVWVISFKRIDH